jgi:hypothetical protein
MASRDTGTIEVGAWYGNRKWGGRHTGAVARCEAGSVFVAWHGSFVEDQRDHSDVEV